MIVNCNYSAILTAINFGLSVLVNIQKTFRSLTSLRLLALCHVRQKVDSVQKMRGRRTEGQTGNTDRLTEKQVGYIICGSYEDHLWNKGI